MATEKKPDGRPRFTYRDYLTESQIRGYFFRLGQRVRTAGATALSTDLPPEERTGEPQPVDGEEGVDPQDGKNGMYQVFRVITPPTNSSGGAFLSGAQLCNVMKQDGQIFLQGNYIRKPGRPRKKTAFSLNSTGAIFLFFFCTEKVTFYLE